MLTGASGVGYGWPRHRLSRYERLWTIGILAGMGLAVLIGTGAWHKLAPAHHGSSERITCAAPNCINLNGNLPGGPAEYLIRPRAERTYDRSTERSVYPPCNNFNPSTDGRACYELKAVRPEHHAEHRHSRY